MPEAGGQKDTEGIDWDNDWGEGPLPEGEEPPGDTPDLEFRPVHAAIPSIGEPFADADDRPDYAGAWLSEVEEEALGDLAGLRVLNVMAGTGEDALALARLGAIVTVVNLSEGAAREAALAEGLTMEFTEVHEQVLPLDLRQGGFDVAYVGPDSLCWIENLDEWAWGVSDALAPGARLVIHDEHPMTYGYGSLEGKLVVNTSYFGDGADVEEGANQPEILTDDGDDAGEEYEPSNFGWTLGDLVTAFGDHGVATVRLEEMASSERFFTALDAIPEVYEDELEKVPGAFLLVGVKLAQG